ncbi:MAG: ABC transporter substrate-binding protein [Clostridia bacterium]|nr:ABC transporter substrate-binding protein [Clostridia bacterium]
MKKRLFIAVFSVLLFFLIIGCSVNTVQEQGNLAGPGIETISVVDHLGRTVTIEKKPERIVSGYYISTSALIALGLEEKLVGIEAKAETRPIYSLAAPQLLALPNVGTAKEFDLEGCISLKPDLVILPVRLKDQIETLEDMGITVIGVNPENQELLAEMITMIAQLTGVDGDKELLAYYEKKEKELIEVHADVSHKPRVYLAGNSDLLSTATKKMYQNDLIEAAGGINVANDIEEAYWANISYEQLIQYNPDYIILTPEAKYGIEDVLKNGNLSGLAAIQNKKVYQMPKNFEAWDSPVPSGILGKMWLTSILYPQKYLYDQFVEEVESFYQKYYGFKVDKEALKY